MGFAVQLFNETAGDETENVGVPPTPVIGGEANDPSMLISQCPPEYNRSLKPPTVSDEMS
jgi:hypothetical protein